MTPAVAGAATAWRTVLFDLDGTIVDTIGLIVASYQHAFREVLGREVDERTARGWIGRPLLGALLEAEPEHGHALDAAYRRWNLAHTERLIRSVDGIAALLDDLAHAGIGRAVVTSKRREAADLALRCVGLDAAVTVVSAMEDTERHKPEPEPLRRAARVLGLAAEDCVYVGDAVVDVEAAHAAGMAAVAVTWGAGEAAALRAARPAAVVDTVAELRTRLLPPGS